MLDVDLAINVYTRSKPDARLLSEMNKGGKEEASFRTRLLRAEQVPFNVLPALT